MRMHPHLVGNVVEKAGRALLHHMLDAHAHFDVLDQPLEELDKVGPLPAGRENNGKSGNPLQTP